MKKGIWLLGLLLCLSFALSCGKKTQKGTGRSYGIYVLNTEETKIFANEYRTESTQINEVIEELLGQLAATPDKLEYKAPLSGGFEFLGYSLEDGQLILNFDQRYKEQPVTTEILVRAAVVRTMSQVEGIHYISFQVHSAPLTDPSGNVVGIMSADMFIDNTESEINTREQTTLRLYFANEEGDELVEVSRTLEYSTNVSLEKLVLEELIRGPGDQVKGGVFPVINAGTKVLGVTVKDGTCYVNLSEHFLTQTSSVTSDVAIYSIVNSLVELSNVNRVQIAVNGNSDIMFRENISLSGIFDRNLDLITAAK